MPLWNSESAAEQPQHTIEAAISKITCIQQGKRNCFTFSTSPLSRGGTAQCQERPSWPMISLRGETEDVSEFLASPGVQETTNGKHFSQPIQNTWGWCTTRGSWETRGYSSQKTSKECGSYQLLSIRKPCQQAAGND